ncbi:mucin-5AC isoform X2 [Harmonia axyridis]|uniref:mucin-5AC isoform X2 n=1 Tax=Harmonia axyridis TaxID=115357 RepID=UPI001E2762EC|nr:mucin-5AC isoform X2 [Harmonia axyridis]
MLSTKVVGWLFLIFGLSICISNSSSKEIRVVCYYTNWSVYRPGTAKFSPQNINPYLCTHLIYAFGGFTKENTLKPFDKYQDIEKGGYAKFTGLKTYNKDLKTMLAIGGWNEASSRFSPMVASADRRKQLVKNSIKFLRQNNFDGLDLDWEYPAFREGGKSRDKENYAKLVQELREEFERESEKTGRTRLLLTMAVPAGIEYVNKGYDIPKLTKYLDWMNILSYDYHSAFEPSVNHHAPLYPMREATEYDYDAELNIDYTIKHYLELGADPSKLVMGVPTYGRSYTLFNPDANAIGDPADGPGEMGEATRENGYLAYYEICENIKSNGWDVVQPNEKAMGPYAFKENQWVGFDDENIARKKAEYVAQNGLGGIMFWAIDNDDFRGSCHGKPYPLIEAAKEALIAASGLTDENLISPPAKSTKHKSRLRSRTKTTEEPKAEKSEVPTKSNGSRRRNRLKPKVINRGSDSEDKIKSRRNEERKLETTSTYSSLKVITPAYTTPEPPSTPDQGGAFKCEDEGFYPHPKDCKKYFWCLSGPGESGIVAHQFTCPAGLYFNKAADSCDYSQNVLCNKKLSKTTSTTGGKETVEKIQTTTQKTSTRAPITRTTTRTTTTTEEEYDDEFEYEDEEISDAKSDSEEDPKVIKELLDLIKKAGGIEELEKQLNFGHDEVGEGATTPSTRTKSIVEKFLTSRTNKISSGTNKYSTINRNSRGPQNAGIEKDTNDENTRKIERKPQYTTISRKRPASSEDRDEVQAEEKEQESASPRYTTIRRSKEGLSQENRRTLDRNKILGEDDKETEDSNRREVTVHTTPQYVNIRRQRPTTEQSSTTQYVSIRRSTTDGSPKEDEKEEFTDDRDQNSDSPVTEKPIPALRYQTLNRSATSTPQISSTTLRSTTQFIPSLESSSTNQPSSISNDVQTESSEIPSTISSKSTDAISTPTTETAEEATFSSSTTSSSIATTTEEIKIQVTKSPVLYEPRPFSVEQKSSISTTHKPVRTIFRSTTNPTKSTRPAARFRIRTRPKSTQKPNTARATFSNNSFSTTSRPKTNRRTYPHFTKIESRVSTTSPPSYSQYTSLSPRITTMMDQTQQSTNQQFLENEKTELGHIAFSLLEKAPLPSSVRPHQISSPNTTPSTIFHRVTSPRTRYISSTLPILLTSTNRFSIRRPQAPKKEPLKISEGFPQYEEIGSYLDQLPKHTKVILHSNGVVECLDQGNFPHPASCRKFISCAKMDHGRVLGWEYTCPKNLSFDPIGGMCNWSAELGCDE